MGNRAAYRNVGPRVAQRPRRHRFGAAGTILALLAGLLVVLGLTPAPAEAAGGILYASVGGTGDCSQPNTACDLTTALSVAAGGDSIELAGGDYVGNWKVTPTSTSAAEPLTIEPVPSSPGVTVTLDGNQGAAAGCTTNACNGPVLSVGANVSVIIEDLTIQDAHNATGNDDGGAIDTGDGVTGSAVTVSAVTFTDNFAGTEGGAIDSGENGGGGSVTVSGSTFTANSSGEDGAAIASGFAGGGSVTVTASTFSGNHAGYNGGAIDSGDHPGGGGSVIVSDSIFTNNSAANDAGAIDSGDFHGTGSVTITDSTFSGNAGSFDAGAIDSGDHQGGGSVSVSGSTFNGNRVTSGGFNGGAIDSGDFAGGGSVIVSDSTFKNNSSSDNGGAIDNGDVQGHASLSVSDSTFSGNTAPGSGPAIDNGDNGGAGSATVAGNVFSDSCHQAGGTFSDAGYNASLNATCTNAGPGDVSGTAVGTQLGPLANNGGLTSTLALLGGNPAIGLVPLNTTVSLGAGVVNLCPRVDQRGDASAGGAACDAGAFELQPSDFPGPPTDPLVSPGPGSLKVSWTDPSPGVSPITGYDVYCSSSGTPATTGAPSVTVTGTDAVSATASGLNNGTPYSCVVTALSAIGPSQPSGIVTGVPGIPPAFTSPAAASFTVGTPGSFTITTNGLPAAALSESGALPPGLTFTDNGDGTATLAATSSLKGAGSYAVTMTAGNNVNPPATQSFTLAVNPASSSVSVTSSSNPSRYGQVVTYTATVGPSDGGGSVAFAAGGSPIPGCSAMGLNLVGASFRTTCATLPLSAGTDNVTAHYTGDTDYLGATGSLSPDQVVTRATLTITAKDATRFYGASNPAFGDTVTGFVNGDGAGVVTGAASLSTSATAGSDVGSYPITVTRGTWRRPTTSSPSSQAP